ncbi:type 2 periplasmic-binding domain-containing protein [Lacticaseibacillus suihuaensis]
MIKSKKLWFISAAILSSLILVGCGGSKSKESSGKDAAYHIVRRGFQDVRPDANKLWMWKERYKQSGVKVDFEEITDASLADKKNVLLASKDQPDAYYGMNFSNTELAKYGGQGLFIPLEKLIKKDAPNLQKLFDKYPDIKAALTQPDGHIYAMPYLNLEDNTKKIYFNKKWMDKLGLKAPTNLKEFKTVLKDFVTKDPNGNGKKDEQGWYNDTTNSFSNTLDRQIMGAYGLTNAGDFSTSALFYLSNNGKKVKMTVTDPKYKEVLKYERDLYKEGLINQQTFGNVTKEKWLADGTDGIVGAYTESGPAQFGAKSTDYVGITGLKGPAGDKSTAVYYPMVAGPSAFMVTSVCKNPAKLVKWMDYMYGEKGIILGAFGKKGVTYNVENGKIVYDKKILDYKDGIQLGAFQWVDNVYGGGYPYVEPTFQQVANARKMTLDQYWQWASPETHSHKFIGKLVGDLPTTQEEADTVTPIMNDIGKYVTQARVDFVTGKTDIDSGWDAYVKQIKKLGADKYMKIKQTQYDRYMKAR